MSDQQPERVPGEAEALPRRLGAHDLRHRAPRGREPLDGVARAQSARPDQRQDGGAHPGGGEELNYRVNPIARALPTGRTNTLGLLVADITNPMIFGIVRGAERAAADAGYTLVIAESQESGEREATAVERVLPSVDGLVLATDPPGRRADRASSPQRKPARGHQSRVEGVATSSPTSSAASSRLSPHLADLGHRSLAYLSGPETSWISRRRWEALLDAAPASAA